MYLSLYNTGAIFIDETKKKGYKRSTDKDFRMIGTISLKRRISFDVVFGLNFSILVGDLRFLSFKETKPHLDDLYN